MQGELYPMPNDRELFTGRHDCEIEHDGCDGKGDRFCDNCGHVWMCAQCSIPLADGDYCDDCASLVQTRRDTKEFLHSMWERVPGLSRAYTHDAMRTAHSIARLSLSYGVYA